METKPFWQSKVFWVNTIAAIGMILQGTGVLKEPISVETQATILGIVNVILRFVTKSAISLK